MKKLRIDDVIRSIDNFLLVVLVVCLALGGIGTVIQFIRFGFLLEPSGPE